MRNLGFYILLVLTLFFCAALVLVPASCSQATQATAKNAATGCLKSIPATTVVQVLVDAGSPDGLAKLEADAVSIGEDLVVCVAKDLLAALTVRASSGSAGPITSQADPALLSLRAFLAKRGVK